MRLLLDFTLAQGAFTLELHERIEAQTVVLFGPSGSGKTTVLEAIAGLRKPDAGAIAIGDRILYSSTRGVDVAPRYRGVGYVPQDVLLFPHLNVRHNITYGMRQGGDGTSLERVLQILEIAPLLDRRVNRLSGGERQRVALARGLMVGPSLLLLDEPLAAVDLPLRRRIMPYLLRVRDELKLPMIYVTHDAGEARALADHVVVLEGGAVVRSGGRSLLEIDESRRFE